ncbi:MAG TPA: peptidylprolyl isomerase [Desulfuromonadales bacterium]|nr:peptidylprolyl isomerase [Desulfuromonadales bacterium]
MNIRFLSGLSLTVLLLAPLSASAAVVNAIAAVVNDDIVSLYEVNREAQPVIREAEKKGAMNEAARSTIRSAVLERLIEKRLVEQKIRELNIKVTEEEVRQAIEDVKRQNNMPSQEALVAALASQGLSFDQYRSQLQEQIEKLKLISMEVRSKIHVGESEAKEYYQANLAKYTGDESYRARHIFFKTNEKSTPEAIKQTMTTALAVLADARDGKDFAELAKKFSEDPAARKDGGDLGSFKKGDMQPELEAAIVAMKPGDVSELVYTAAGFHIIKLEERLSGALKSFESVKTEIDEALYRKKSEERFSQWAKELREKASIEVKDLKGML